MADYGRTRQNFPSRQYSYSGRGQAAFAADIVIEVGKTLRFVLGQDQQPVEILPDEGRVLLNDPMAQLVLFSGEPLPLSLRALLAQLDRFNTDAIRGLPLQRSFVVADGGQIAWTPETD